MHSIFVYVFVDLLVCSHQNHQVISHYSVTLDQVQDQDLPDLKKNSQGHEQADLVLNFFNKKYIFYILIYNKIKIFH